MKKILFSLLVGLLIFSFSLESAVAQTSTAGLGGWRPATQTMAPDGVMEGDLFGGYYGVFVTNPMSRGLVRMSDQFPGVRVAGLDIIKPEAMQKTLEIIGEDPNTPIAYTVSQLESLKAQGYTRIRMSNPTMPGFHEQLWIKGENGQPDEAVTLSLAGQGIVSKIIWNGPEVAKFLYDNRNNPNIQNLMASQQWGLSLDYLKQVASRPVSSGTQTTTTSGTIQTTGTSSGTPTSPISTSVVTGTRSQIDNLFKQFDDAVSNTPSTTIATNTNTQTSTVATNASCYIFNTDLRLGNSGSEVTNLTARLVKEGMMTSQKSTFDQEVFNAVIKYQEKYKNEILAPFNLSIGTGFFGQSTRAHMNKSCGVTTTTQTTTSPTTSTQTSTLSAAKIQEIQAQITQLLALVNSLLVQLEALKTP